jgi:hypothetical protein
MIKKDYVGQLTVIFGIMMIVLFFVLGIYILISPSFNYIPKNFRTIFAIVLIAYGFFRLVTIYQKYKKREE